jgi:hypothetical protein
MQHGEQNNRMSRMLVPLTAPGLSLRRRSVLLGEILSFTERKHSDVTARRRVSDAESDIAKVISLVINPVLPVRRRVRDDGTRDGDYLYAPNRWAHHDTRYCCRYAYGCLFGLMSAQSGCTVALVYDTFFAVCNMIFSIDYLLNDGHIFYTRLFEGKGNVLFAGMFVCAFVRVLCTRTRTAVNCVSALTSLHALHAVRTGGRVCAVSVARTVHKVWIGIRVLIITAYICAAYVIHVHRTHASASQNHLFGVQLS